MIKYCNIPNVIGFTTLQIYLQQRNKLSNEKDIVLFAQFRGVMNSSFTRFYLTTHDRNNTVVRTPLDE